MSGDPLSGWTVGPDSSWASILAAAKASPYLFQPGTSGAYQVEIANLPGDIRTYYHICKDEAAAQYTIGYYYSTADSLENVSEANTWRIDADPTDGKTQYALERVFSMDLYVTDLKNRLLVQKVNNQGEPLDGAEFALYKASDLTLGSDGSVTVNPGAAPYDSLTTGTVTGVLNLEGGGIFPTAGKVLEKGEYYLVETTAPAGYKKYESAIPVVVDDTGVYADAGTAADGVSVLRGVGSLMRSMVQFAVDDGVDTTLNSIRAALVSGTRSPDGSFTWGSADWQDPAQVLHLQFANANKVLDYGSYDTATTGIEGLTLTAQEGWSRLLIRQCYRHDGTVDTDLKTDLGETDLTGLFSGTVTVRVTDEAEGSGGLQVVKQVSGAAGETHRAWNFTITLTGPGAEAVTGRYGQLEFSAGQASFTLKSGESCLVTGLPEGLSYQVSEAEAGQEGYDTQAKNESGTIQADRNALVYFLNSREQLPLTPTPTPTPEPSPTPTPAPSVSDPPQDGPTPSQPAESAAQTVPATGDPARLLPWALALAAALAVLGWTLRRRKNR